MAAKDFYHDDVRAALVKDAWTITDDPFRLRWGKKDYYVDLLTCEALFDRPRSRFALITLGWDDEERVHHPLVHIDIVADKLWIQTDNTEHGIAPELVQAGIPKSNGRNRLPALVQRWPSTRVTTCGGGKKGLPGLDIPGQLQCVTFQLRRVRP